MKLLQHTGFEVRLVKHLCRSPRDYVIMVLGGGSAVGETVPGVQRPGSPTGCQRPQGHLRDW